MHSAVLLSYSVSLSVCLWRWQFVAIYRLGYFETTGSLSSSLLGAPTSAICSSRGICQNFGWNRGMMAVLAENLQYLDYWIAISEKVGTEINYGWPEDRSLVSSCTTSLNSEQCALSAKKSIQARIGSQWRRFSLRINCLNKLFAVLLLNTSLQIVQKVWKKFTGNHFLL